jgi:hypothetical protein
LPCPNWVKLKLPELICSAFFFLFTTH